MKVIRTKGDVSFQRPMTVMEHPSNTRARIHTHGGGGTLGYGSILQVALSTPRLCTPAAPSALPRPTLPPSPQAPGNARLRAGR